VGPRKGEKRNMASRSRRNPQVVAFLGTTGSGKSEALNAITGKQIFATDAVRPKTIRPQYHEHENCLLVDLPGIGEADVSRNSKWLKQYMTVLSEGVKLPVLGRKLDVHIVVWLLKADARDYILDANFYHDFIKKMPRIRKRQTALHYAISQADKIEPMRDDGGWDTDKAQPGSKQLANIIKKRRAIAACFERQFSTVVAFSATESYNVDKLKRLLTVV